MIPIGNFHKIIGLKIKNLQEIQCNMCINKVCTKKERKEKNLKIQKVKRNKKFFFVLEDKRSKNIIVEKN